MTPLRRLRLALDAHDSDLLLVGDRFEEGGRYVQAEISRSTSAAWTWVEWDLAYDRLARDWRSRFTSVEPAAIPAPGAS
jgi:hypothetical protein